MPRDDLSIDFVKRMPLAEPLDPALILDDWINRVQNLPEEIRFLQNEIADKDRQYHDCIRIIEDRDGKIQKWIKANGSHTENPREDALRAQIRENYTRADQLAADKVALTQKLQLVMDKHLRNLDAQVKLLYDRAEPGFVDPDEVPSLLRPSAANHSAPSARAVNPAANGFPAAASVPLTPITGNAASSTNLALSRVANPQVRHAQSQMQHAASAPATPAASSMLGRPARENSAGPVPKRVARAGSGLGALTMPTSGLARHSSLGPGTPKGATASGALGAGRAGSAGPRAGSTKSATGAGIRRGTPTSMGGRKKGGAAAPATKSNLSRVKKASTKNSPASTADSELSDAESGSGGAGSGSDSGSEAPAAGPSATGGGGAAAALKGGPAGRQRSGTPVIHSKEEDDEDEDEDEADEDAADGDDDEASDDKKYCSCQNVSFGDMVACDNEDCPFEWFHWACVGLKSEPTGKWYCPICSKKMEKK